jgi:hypothetical protein
MISFFTLLFNKYLAGLSKAVRTPRGDQLEKEKNIIKLKYISFLT